MEVAARSFPGEVVEYAIRDPRSKRYFASVTHGQFGPHLFYADDPAGQWQQAEGPAFPSNTGAAVERIWVIEPGVGDGELWCGVAPAALFHSSDGGKTWSLVQSLWDVPERAKWNPGAGGLCLHSICPWPGDAQAPGDRHFGRRRLADRGCRQELATRRSRGLVPALPAGGGPRTTRTCTACTT